MSWRNDIKAAVKQVFDDHVPDAKCLTYFPSVEPDAERLAIIEVADETVEQRNLSKALRHANVVVHLIWYTSDPDTVTEQFEDFVDAVVDQLLAHRNKPGEPALHGQALSFARTVRVVLDPPVEDGVRIFAAHVEVDADYEISLS